MYDGQMSTGRTRLTRHRATPHLRTLLTTAFQSYVATDDQVFIHLDELPMILDHIDEIAVRRGSSTSTWTGKPLVVLTATKG